MGETLIKRTEKAFYRIYLWFKGKSKMNKRIQEEYAGLLILMEKHFEDFKVYVISEMQSSNYISIIDIAENCIKYKVGFRKFMLRAELIPLLHEAAKIRFKTVEIKDDERVYGRKIIEPIFHMGIIYEFEDRDFKLRFDDNKEAVKNFGENYFSRLNRIIY